MTSLWQELINFLSSEILFSETTFKLPVIDLSLGGVTARCFASEPYLALMNEHKEAVSPKMSDNEKTREKTREKILTLIRENNKITTHELAEALSLTDKGVEWQLKQLKDKKVIIRVGADKGGYWEIVQGVDK